MIPATPQLERALQYLQSELREAIFQEGQLAEIAGGAEILREGQYVKVIPLVLSGLIKVFSRFEDRELLLYYIQPQESCIMSFAAMLEESPSRIYAVAEESTQAILLPSRLVRTWIRHYPSLNQLFFQQYNKRYDELLNTIHHLLFNRLDERLLEYLREKTELRGTRRLQLHHRQIAGELGTVREVVSRLLKKLEKEGKVQQLAQGWIEIL